MRLDAKGKIDPDAVHEAWRKATEASQEWREEALRAYRYVAGDQWDEEDLEILNEQRRPAVTFNRTEVYVSVVCGLQILQREEARILPRRPGPVEAHTSDLWTSALDYVSDTGNAYQGQTAAFRDLVTCGMGWCESRMDYTCDAEGKIIPAERLSPLEMYWDWNSTADNLTDSRWRMRVSGMSREEVEERWPDAGITYSHVFEPQHVAGSPHSNNPESWYDQVKQPWDPSPEDRVYVAQVQWWRLEPYMRVFLPDGPKDVTLKEYKQAKEMAPDIAQFRAVKLERKQYRQAFLCGSTVLEDGPAPRNGFTLLAMTGKHDVVQNCWYGVVRLLFDPQDWTNKLYSSILHTIATSAKGGGLLLEETAVSPRNKNALEDDWARPDKIKYVADGAISGNRLMTQTPAPYPAGVHQLMEVAVAAMTAVTGANPELMGMAEKVQPGVLEAQRKQAGMTMLAWAFDAFRNYMREYALSVCDMVREYIADGRLVRIAGPQGQEYVPLLRDRLAQEFDVVVDLAPQSTNERERVFGVLTQIAPLLIQAGVMPPAEVLDYLPLPATLTEAWKRQVNPDNPEAQQAAQQQQEMQQAAFQAELRLKQAEAQSKMADAQLKAVQARRANDQSDIQAYQAQSKEAADERKANLDAMRLMLDAQQQRAEQAQGETKAYLERLAAQTQAFMAQMEIVGKSLDLQAQRNKQRDEERKRQVDMERQLIGLKRDLLSQQTQSAETLRNEVLSQSVGSAQTMEALGKQLGKMQKVMDGLQKQRSAGGGDGKAVSDAIELMRNSMEGLRTEMEGLRSQKAGPVRFERDADGQVTAVNGRRVRYGADGLVEALE